MTVEEAEEILARGKPPFSAERSKKDAPVIADIITRLQQENISYLRAIFLLDKCKDVIGKATRI